jgi:hypothetical protein
MTFVLSVTGRDTLWMVADRRVSYSDGRRPDDEAVKIMVLETTDGRGLLGYAGLGATPADTQPSEWMSAVLRGRAGITFERALSILADAATRELPIHLATLPGGGHYIVAPAYVRDSGARLYLIENVVDHGTGQHRYRNTRYDSAEAEDSRIPRLVLGGSGSHYLLHKSGSWRRDLRRLVKAHDRGKISDYLVADQFAKLNYEVHCETKNGTVGNRCIVVWRRRPGAPYNRPAGKHQFYTDTTRDRSSPAIPTVGNGMDIQALVNALMPQSQFGIANRSIAQGPPTLDYDELNRRLASISIEPDEKLRLRAR